MTPDGSSWRGFNTIKRIPWTLQVLGERLPLVELARLAEEPYDWREVTGDVRRYPGQTHYSFKPAVFVLPVNGARTITSQISAEDL